MRYLKSTFYLLAGFIFFNINIFAQEIKSDLISGDFAELTFDQFVKIVESQTGYFFYYDIKHVDSLRISLKATQQPIKVILDQLFEGTNLRYAIDAQKHVYITKDIPIQTSLPFGFFDKSNNPVVAETPIPDYFNSDKKAKQKAVTESKLYEIGAKTATIQPGNAILSGHIRDARTGEPVVGAVVYIEGIAGGTSSDQFGHYSISILKGRSEIKIKSIGMKTTKRQIMLYSDGNLDINMQEDIVALREVLIESDKDLNVKGMQMGVEKLDMKTMKQVPSVFGETDILRVILALPGVQSVGESSTGLNVRGGAADQNLILFNDATIYNPSHLFGFFSAFNPDVVKDVELFKSSIPAEYGGRLSSVLKITAREGNKKKFGGSAGIGLLTGRITLEGPIIKNKTSFLLGARSTYSDWILKQIPSPAIKNSQASFYDLNANISHEINDKNSLNLTGYYSKDQFKLNGDTAFSYSNKNAILKWSHVFNSKFYSVFTGGYSGYNYAVSSIKNQLNANELTYSIDQSNLKADFNYMVSPKHTLDFGASSTFYKVFPGSMAPKGAASLIKGEKIQPEQGLESALYLADHFDVSTRFSLYLGLRYSLYNYLGPKNTLNYAKGLPIESNNVVDSTSYAAGAFIKTYQGPEWRFSARYSLSATSSIKLSYNRTRQYINMLSNTTAISPTDIWKLSDQYIRPQVADQFSVGLYKNLKSNTIETSVEAYYKDIYDAISYKNGAQLNLNPTIETDIVNGKGKAYGVELMLKKNAGKVNGWVSYTYSRTLIQINDPGAGAVVNNGSFFPNNYDKPHSVNFIGNYRFNRRFSVSINMVYSTGRPITLPVTKFELNGSTRVYYSDRNEYRVPDYFRTDLSLNIEGTHKVKKLAHSSWTIAVYNITGRQNVYSIYFKTENGALKGYQMSIFGQPIPTITYNCRF